MAALRSFKRICGPLQLLLLLLLLLQDLVEPSVEPSQPHIRGPQGRVTAGSWASFTCSADNLPSQDMQVNWLKRGKRIQPNQTKNSTSESGGARTYQVTSSVSILLGEGDIRSYLTCQIQYNSSQKVQKKSFLLGDVLTVPPKVRLETIPPSPIQVNTSVMVTCKAERFYPKDATVELFANDALSIKGMVAPRISNPDGSYSLKSYLEVTATEHRNSSVFLCQVHKDSQPWVVESNRFFITRPLKTSEYSQKQSILVLCITLFLSKAAVLLLISCLFLIKASVYNRTKPRSGTSQEVRQSATSS